MGVSRLAAAVICCLVFCLSREALAEPGNFELFAAETLIQSENTQWIPGNKVNFLEIEPAGVEIHPAFANLTLFVARGKVAANKLLPLPAKIYFPFTRAIVSFNGTNYETTDFEVCISRADHFKNVFEFHFDYLFSSSQKILSVPEHSVSWVPVTNQWKPNLTELIYGGVHNIEGKPVYVCRAKHVKDKVDQLVVGWYEPDLGVCSIAFGKLIN